MLIVLIRLVAVSSGLFLFGCVLLYGAAGTTSVQEKILITVSLLYI